MAFHSPGPRLGTIEGCYRRQMINIKCLLVIIVLLLCADESLGPDRSALSVLQTALTTAALCVKPAPVG